MKWPIQKRCILMWVALCAMLALIGGCSDDDGVVRKENIGLPDPEPDRTTRVGLLDCLLKAHENRDVELYMECLHSDFRFWFSSDDLGDPSWDWLEWIGKAEDIEITARMFASEEVVDIRIDLVNATDIEGVANDEDRFDTLLIPGDLPVTAYWAEFLADIHVIEETQEDRIDHWVDGRAQIYLIADPDSSGQWQIWKIEDRGNEHRKSERTTWGKVKKYYAE